MKKTFQVLFCIKLEKLGILINIRTIFSGFVPYVLNNVNKVYQAGKNFLGKIFFQYSCTNLSCNFYLS
jgi:hypothetical protein